MTHDRERAAFLAGLLNLKSPSRKGVQVRILPPAPSLFSYLGGVGEGPAEGRFAELVGASPNGFVNVTFFLYRWICCSSER